jgi:predicted nucleic acid-binding protein
VSYVVDASVAIKWFIPEPLQDRAQSLLYAEGGQLEAPDFLIAEVANIAWKKAMRQEITASQANVIPNETRNALAVCHPSIELIEDALSIALQLRHPIYDCIYLAYAERIDRTLITADLRLCHAIAHTHMASAVRWLGNPAAFEPKNLQ